MYVGFHQLEKGVVKKGEGLNLNMEEWTVFLQVMDAIDEEICCSKPVEPIPDTYGLIDIVYRSVFSPFQWIYLLSCNL